MSLSITQTPAEVSLAQSPIIFTVAESNGALLTSSSFQYVGELYYWTGTPFQSASVGDYTITKFPNTATVGIFDLNRIINSTLTDLLQQNSSNVVYFACDFYPQWIESNVYTTGSHLKSSTYKALDGYGIFQEPIGQQIMSKSVHWPLMTDGPVTQSVLDTNKGVSGVYVGTTGGTVPTKVLYTSNLGSADYFISSSTSTSGQIDDYPIGPLQSGFPLSTTGLEWFRVQAYNGSTALGTSIRYNVVCNQQYPNVRIKWKNRFGQFDWLNFNLVNRKSFSTTKRTYQPQLGSWESSTLSYQNYDSGILNYIVDTEQGLLVNSNYLPETYNDIFKQLLVSDEIYWITDESTGALQPITITTSNVVFKTGVNDKLIQYQFEFNLGQPYKLIM